MGCKILQRRIQLIIKRALSLKIPRKLRTSRRSRTEGQVLNKCNIKPRLHSIYILFLESVY